MDDSKLAYDQSLAALTAAGSDFETITRTIDGVDYTVYKNAPSSLQDVYTAATAHGDKEFIVCSDHIDGRGGRTDQQLGPGARAVVCCARQ